MKINLLLVLTMVIIGTFGCTESKTKASKNNIPMESKAQIVDEAHQEVFERLRENDSLLFELGFNQCDTNQLKLLTSNDFEFYHDQSGITNSKPSFLQSIAGLCQLSYKPTRVLAPNSLEVHILRDNGEIYGAIQNGKHLFYGEEENKPIYLTSTADFTHLWIIEEGGWKLKRVLSYNHISPENE